MKIPKPKHFNFQACLDFLNRGYDECLYLVNDSFVRRLIRITSGLVFIEISSDSININIRAHREASTYDKEEILIYVKEWFDLERDLSEFYVLMKKHQQTKDFPIDYQGLRLMGIVDLFEALCWCVIGQQINLTFAHKIKTRLVHKYGESIEVKGQKYHIFPTPQTLLNAKKEDLVAMQFSKQKINYIHNISQAFCNNELNKDELLKLPKSQQMDKLLAIKGIGPWTANYVSMKSLRDMTSIAYGDTGLSLSLHQVFDTERKPDKNTIDSVFKPFAGWESYLNFYLWKTLS